MEEGQEAGLIGYYDENSWVSFGIGTQGGAVGLFLREHIGTEDRLYKEMIRSERQTESAQTEDCLCLSAQSVSQIGAEDGAPEQGRLTLFMKTEGLKREFYYSYSDVPDRDDRVGERKLFQRLQEVSYLSDEGVKMGKRFTGAAAGMFAYEGAEAEKPFIVRMENFYYGNNQ